ncbi:MAG: hypothetical protein A2Z83_01905 [Omnitrophica bacterium GWA2_52_8]|nr:MAG: hypothetical protein A2Z83_01905 [Omnitrophica bacterium GWA2_52_8]
MVCELGMSKKLGLLTYGKRDGQVFLGRDIMTEKNYSENTAVMIDEEVRRIVSECHVRAKSIVEKNREKLEKLADRVLEKEVLEAEEIKMLVGIQSQPPAV